MHLCEYPCRIAGKQKPRDGGVLIMFKLFASQHCHRGAALPSMNELSTFLTRFQLKYEKSYFQNVFVHEKPAEAGSLG